MEINTRLTRTLIIVFSMFIIGLVGYNTYLFYNQLKENERDKMEIFSKALGEMAETSNSELGLDESPLIIEVIRSNTTTPLILHTLKGDSYDLSNIPNGDQLSREEIEDMVEAFKQTNPPIETRYEGDVLNIIYYGNAPIITKVKYYPAAILLVIMLFVGFIYFFYQTTKSAEQNKLWAGMAKETAHQIGTPLSSLVGWTEILKAENTNPAYISEIEKDISRLQTITERFSKVGSKPKLEERDVVRETQLAYDYLKSRTSKLIHFELELPEKKIPVMLNEQLFGWTVENLVKNGIDAMKGKGKISIKITEQTKTVTIHVTDTGKGIPKRDFKKIFTPGFTTKKRGWGLGLSLAKRIIEEYHEGNIKVLKSAPNVGTTMEIQLKRL
ncbi:HAMP domain-containing sensor histidine kinase [Gilvibacter sp.]|uniref:sensor histidine kinase n=1 Tax=Gilvibacter sp. TaxID=2729997 RepID=UPI0025C5E198|nr:HAMP domain-containing sensor histidine kinase [Gilvibacter sp.]NQX78809.1 HAMP domain-containing histidine kinase [Gilvibacter sp.]